MRYLLTLRQQAPLLHSHASSSASVVRALPTSALRRSAGETASRHVPLTQLRRLTLARTLTL